MLKSSVLSVAAAMIVIAPAIAQEKQPSAATPVKEKRICRSAGETGSIMPSKRVCHTAAEWTALDGANAEQVQRMRDRNMGRPGSGG